MKDPTLGGFIAPGALGGTEEAAQDAYLRRHFPALQEGAPSDGERLAELAGPDVAALPDADMLEGWMRRFPGAVR